MSPLKIFSSGLGASSLRLMMWCFHMKHALGKQLLFHLGLIAALADEWRWFARSPLDLTLHFLFINISLHRSVLTWKAK